MKRKLLISSLILSIGLGNLSALAESPTGLTDIDHHWAQSEIENLFKRTIVQGYVDRTFKPDKKVSREEAATMISKYLGDKKGDISIPLDDIVGRWSEMDIRKLVSLGIINGYDESTFKPENEVTRAEFSKMIAMTIPDNASDKRPTLFHDVPYHWAEEYINKLSKNQLINGYGDGSFRPDEKISRAEIAKIISDKIILDNDLEMKGIKNEYDNEENSNNIDDVIKPDGNNEENSNNNESDDKNENNNSNNDESDDNNNNNSDSNNEENNNNSSNDIEYTQESLGYNGVKNLYTPGVDIYGDEARITIEPNEMWYVEEHPQNKKVQENDPNFLNLYLTVDYKNESSYGINILNGFDEYGGYIMNPNGQSELSRIYRALHWDGSEYKGDDYDPDLDANYDIEAYCISNPEINELRQPKHYIDEDGYPREKVFTNLEEFNRDMQDRGFYKFNVTNFYKNLPYRIDPAGKDIFTYYCPVVEGWKYPSLTEVKWVKPDGTLFKPTEGFPLKVKTVLTKKSTGEQKIYYTTFRIRRVFELRN